MLGPVGGGRYAVYQLAGPYDGIARAYCRLVEEWLPGSGKTMADRPCMELYRNTPLNTAPERLVTDLCLALREETKG